MTFVLRSVEGDRVGRAELSAISATLGEGWALTRARDTVEGEPGANAPGTETTAGLSGGDALGDATATDGL